MLKPSFKIKETTQEKDYLKVIFEPLEPGFGNTMGVALRRTLLTGIGGAAITSVKISGATHMFSTIKGVKEDVIELILNIKSVRVKLAEEKDTAVIRINKTGPGDVTAKDIEISDGVEIINTDQHLASLSDKKAKLDAEMTIQRGLGYSLAEERNIETLGVIPIDAIFSPIKKVNYKVEETRVGRQTNFDKLTLEVWTDGTVDTRSAVDEASKILVSYFKMVYAGVEEVEEDESLQQDEVKEHNGITIDELDLPTRIYNSLRNAGIETVGQLITIPKKELMTYRNLGAKSLSIIKESLEARGVPFEV
jgi:DNA-directed RNA polymerase subunit alpha